MRYERHGRFWAVYDAAGQMVCLAVYKKGAREVLRRLATTEPPPTLVTPSPGPSRKRGT